MALALGAKILHHVGLGIKNIIGRLVFLYLPLFSIAFGYFVARCAMNHVH
jgi:hypothetical protein